LFGSVRGSEKDAAANRCQEVLKGLDGIFLGVITTNEFRGRLKMRSDAFNEGNNDTGNLGAGFHGKDKRISCGMITNGKKESVAFDIWV
jgi:hypothetical protein